MTEFDKLVKMLDEAKIPYDRTDDVFDCFGSMFGMYGNRYHIEYPHADRQNTKGGTRVCSVIFGRGTYGYEDGLLEIMGLLTPEELEMDDVVGYLTAEDVFNRIKKHYDEHLKED